MHTPLFLLINISFLLSSETHAFLPSPFYKGQYQSLNGKVVAIEKGYVTEVSGKYCIKRNWKASQLYKLNSKTTLGFQQLRTIRIISEETHYSQRRKITVLTIDRPLEGEIKVWGLSGWLPIFLMCGFYCASP